MPAIRREYGSWLELLFNENDLDSNAEKVAQQEQLFLKELEITSLTKSFKLVLIETFLDLNGFSQPPELSALSVRSWHTLKRRHQLSSDVPEEFKVSISDSAKSERAWISYWRGNPVRAWIGREVFLLNSNYFSYYHEVNASDIDTLTELTQELVDLRYLQYEERMDTEEAPTTAVPVEPLGSEIPFFTDLRIACGFFRESPHEREAIELTRLPLKYGKLNPALHFIARARGDSMNGGPHPICDGDHLLLEAITTQSAGSINNHIIAIENQSESGDDQYLLRRAEKIGPNQYDLIALNPNYATIQSDESMRTFARLKEIIDPFDLHLHRVFMRADIPALFGLEFNKGVWEQGHVCPKAIDDQILLVTLNKRSHNMEHRYHDYFEDAQTFHWQSQNRSNEDNTSGQKIINHVANQSSVHLFVRKHKLTNKKAAPFVYLGKVTYKSHTGGGPMSVLWDMDEVLPPHLVEEFI